MRPRILMLPIAGLVIAGLVWHKLSQEQDSRPFRFAGPSPVFRPAPEFEALDQENSITRLKSFLGRHELFIVFFDRETGAGGNAHLQHLKRHAEELQAAGFQVFGISDALPQENRRTVIPSFFTLVTDPSPEYRIHRKWGVFDEQTREPQQAVFYVDRAGNVATEDNQPVPLSDPARQIDTILEVSAH